MKSGDKGPAVQRMQQRLSDLGYWLGTPDGEYGYLTQQAVMALQKTAGLGRDGVYGPATRAALERGVVPKLVVSGNAVQISLANQVLTVVENSRIVAILNTSTGSGETYVSQGVTKTAITFPMVVLFFRSAVDDHPEGHVQCDSRGQRPRSRAARHALPLEVLRRRHRRPRLHVRPGLPGLARVRPRQQLGDGHDLVARSHADGPHGRRLLKAAPSTRALNPAPAQPARERFSPARCSIRVRRAPGGWHGHTR